MNWVMQSTVEYGDDWFAMTGPQLLSERLVKMTCRFRNDGKPARFLFRGHIIEALAKNIADHDARGLTAVGNGKVRVRQVEHVLSALSGMGALDTDVDLQFIDGNGNETEIAPPVGHLNSREVAIAIMSAFHSRNPDREGVKAVDLDKAYVVVEKKGETDPSVAVFAPSRSLHLTVQLNFPHFWGQQSFSEVITPLSYLRSICWARSFFSTAWPHKGEWTDLRKRYPGLLRERENHYRSVMIDFKQEKWITPVVVESEPARHKMLDVVGDLALLGVKINAAAYVYKPHHQFNRQCVLELTEGLGLFSS